MENPTPLPVNGTACGLPGALSAIEIVAFLLPPVAGARMTLMLQLVEGASVPTQLFVSLNSDACKPMIEMLEMVSVAFPTLVAEMTVGALEVPIATFPKVTLV